MFIQICHPKPYTEEAFACDDKHSIFFHFHPLNRDKNASPRGGRKVGEWLLKYLNVGIYTAQEPNIYLNINAVLFHKACLFQEPLRIRTIYNSH
jgi:hypothetical protein